MATIFDNCLDYVVSYYGCLKAGGVVAPLSTDLRPDSLYSILRNLEPQVIIASSKFEKLLRNTDIASVGIKDLFLTSQEIDWSDPVLSVHSMINIKTEEGKTDNPGIDIKETDLASIIYTSGSTGKAKGVMLTHKNIVENTNSICEYLELTENDIQMCVLPFFYVMGKSLLNTHFAVGGSVVINNKFAFPAAVVKQMVEEKVTGFSGVPSTFAYLLHRSPLESYRDKLTSLRYCSQAGGHMAKHTKLELRRVLPVHTKIYVMYGATEASARLSYLEPERFHDKIESIGKAIPGVTLIVLDTDGKRLPPGQNGELVANGLNIMQGYWRDEETTSRSLDHNGYHTGDLAYQDEDGYFYITGRRDNLIKVGGHRINTQEIEDVLFATDLLVEAVVLGLPDKLLGNKIIAVAVTKKDSYKKELIIKECAKKLPKYKLPVDIKLVSSLPKSSNGKIDRQKIIEHYKRK